MVQAPAARAAQELVRLTGMPGPQEVGLDEPELALAVAALAALGGHAGTLSYSSSSVQQKQLDELELRMLGELRPVDLPLVHRFTPGLYVREIFMPAGTLLTSKVHMTEHPFVITRGAVSVYVPGVGVEHFRAPHVGITQPGTRRALYIHEDTTWLTFHPLAPGEEGPEHLAAIEERIIARRELPDGRSAHEIYVEMLRLLDEAGDPWDGQLDYGGAP